MKRIKGKLFNEKVWLVLAAICLPVFLLAGTVLMARRAAAERRHQHELNTALFQAAQTNAVPQVEALLAKGAEANAMEYYEEPDVSLPALWQQWWKRIRGVPLSAEGANNGFGESAFSATLRNAYQTQFKDWRVLKLLADHGANVNERGFYTMSQSALDWTTELQNWDATNYLLERGENPNPTGMSGSNPFLQTVACDNLRVVTKMLDKGAEVNFVPKGNGATPLGCAVIHKNTAMIRLLLDRGADINLPDAQGETPLHRCQGNAKEVDLANLLLDKGADPNRQDKEGNTPLMASAAKGDSALTRLYLIHKANSAIRNQKGQTALQLAQSQKHTDIVTMLIRASTNASSLDRASIH